MLIFLTDIKTMEEYTFLAPLLLTIGGLIIGAILKSLLKRIILGVMNRTGVFQSLPELHDAVSSVANINPDLILYLFLPILIFDAAYELNLHIFKKTLANATLLAAPGLIICMLLTGALMMGVATFIPGFESWTWAFNQCHRPGSRSSPAARVENQQTLLYPCRCGIPAERWYRHRLLHAFLRSIRRRRSHSRLSCHYVYP